MSAAYSSTCSNPVTCNKPSSETDANSNETDYTYDPVHGGITSEMQPPPAAGAARPLKLTNWVQKTPYYKNPSGTLVASSTPIWVVNTVTECQTVAGGNTPVCDNSAPKRVTTYEYGANGTANALWPHGIAVTADGTTRRTCYSYDALGDKISETSPRAGLASCP
jgi:YD repeat-containing protein